MKKRTSPHLPPQPERIPRTLVRAQLGHNDCSKADWLGIFDKIFGEWAAFAGKYSRIDPDAAKAEGQANRSRCECQALAGILQAERAREELLASEWVGFTRDITANEMIAAREWTTWDAQRRQNYLNLINDLKDKRTATEQAWRGTSEQIGFFNKQLETGCAGAVKDLLRDRWDTRRERLENSSKFLAQGGATLRQKTGTRYNQTGGLLLKTVAARNAVAKLVGSYTGKPVHAFSSSLSKYLGAAPK